MSKYPEAAVLTIALVARAAVLLATQGSGFFSDMHDYHSRATMIRSGDWMPDSFRGPAFPVFVALMYAMPGPDLLMARAGNAALVSGSAVLGILLAREFVSPRASLAAGLIVALYPASILSTVYLMPESLYSFLIVLTLVLARRVTPARWAAAGVTTAVTALTRSIGIGLMPALALSSVAQWRGPDRRRVVTCVALLSVTCAIALLPWFWHTSRVSGGLMLDSSSAYNVLLGANPRARERLEIADGGWVWETYFAGVQNEADRNRRALEASWNWIRQNPWTWLRLMPLKMTYLWGLEGREHAWAYSNSYFGPRSVTTVRAWAILLAACFPPLALAACIGLLRPGLLRSPTGAAIAFMLGLTTLMHGISFSETRYHLPLVPLLAILATRGVAGNAPLSPARWGAVLGLTSALAIGWWRQWPELMDRFQRLTVQEGWKTMLPF